MKRLLTETPPHRGFTLIEIMIVVSIMGLIMAMSVPFIHNLYHKEALRKAVSDIVEVCSNARAMAIMHSTRTEVIFHPKEGTFSVSGSFNAPRPPRGRTPAHRPRQRNCSTRARRSRAFRPDRRKPCARHARYQPL